jgi:hypothetical protein
VLAAFGVPRSAFRVKKEKHCVVFANLSNVLSDVSSDVALAKSEASSVAEAVEDRLAKKGPLEPGVQGVLALVLAFGIRKGI